MIVRITRNALRPVWVLSTWAVIIKQQITLQYRIWFVVSLIKPDQIATHFWLSPISIPVMCMKQSGFERIESWTCPRCFQAGTSEVTQGNFLEVAFISWYGNHCPKFGNVLIFIVVQTSSAFAFPLQLLKLFVSWTINEICQISTLNRCACPTGGTDHLAFCARSPRTQRNSIIMVLCLNTTLAPSSRSTYLLSWRSLLATGGPGHLTEWWSHWNH